MQAGKIQHPLRVQQREVVRNPDTGDVITVRWVDVIALIWASVESLSGREWLAAAASQSAVTSRIVTRRDQRITADMRFVATDGTVYSIESPPLPDKQGGREYQSHMVSEGVNDGE